MKEMNKNREERAGRLGQLPPTYTRRSLAELYYPGCDPVKAVRRLTRSIKRCGELYGELCRRGGEFDRRRILTVREARLIMEYLGDPWEE